MPMKHRVSLQAVSLPVAVVEAVEIEAPAVEFDPESGKASDNPFDDSLGFEVEEEITFINNYEVMRVVDLKEILRQRGLPVSGTKAVLIMRLEMSDAEATSVAIVDDEEDPALVAASEGEVSKYGKPEQSVGEPDSNAT